MNNTKYTIGIDFGTLSGRALLVRVSDGAELGSTAFDYPHAVMDEYLVPDSPNDKRIKLPPDWALQHPRDYIYALKFTVPALIKKCGVTADDIIGIGIDFTACTMFPVYADGTPLCFSEKYKYSPHAYAKLWKHHAAQSYANRITETAAERNESWLSLYGGRVSSEWFIPKIWQVLEEDAEIYSEAAYFIEAGDWIIWQLTGAMTRNSCAAGYKSMYHEAGNTMCSYPDSDFFKALDPRLENITNDKLSGKIIPVGSCAGYVTENAAKLTGLKAGTAVAAANVDAHAAAPAVKITSPGKMLAIIGTSTCHMLISDKKIPIPGICGVVKDGILPGFYGYEAGQSCVGDHFAWLAENLAPAEYTAEAKERNLPVIRIMVEKASKLKPGESGILALDWWNGNRSVLADADLSGMFIGMNLNTKAEELFRALIEATAFGTRMIIENYIRHGLEVNEFYASGGIASKDPFTMQVYADIIGLDIQIAGSSQGPALGSAIFAAYAAGADGGGYSSLEEAASAMGKLSGTVYHPVPENQAVYDKLYAEYKKLHDYFGKGENNVMKRLRKIKAAQHV